MHKKCPNPEFFLVRFLLYSDQKNPPYLDTFHAVPAPFSSAHPQQLTQPPLSLTDNFEYFDSNSSFDNTSSASNDAGARKPKMMVGLILATWTSKM